MNMFCYENMRNDFVFYSRNAWACNWCRFAEKNLLTLLWEIVLLKISIFA